MKTLVGAIVLCVASILPTGQMSAQPQSCEDSARVIRLLAEQYAASRNRTEIEAAQTIAGLVKQVEALRAELEAVRKGAK